MGSIIVENIGKSYKTYRGRWGRLASWFGISRGVTGEHWVLRDINFKLKPGEAVGVIGMNGAGKSTLLKLITGTTRPTEGTINMAGRVSALLELGMGFHPDLTGRQNAYLSGSLLGLTQNEITELMPAIEAFAEIGEYIDQPVRVYSSGMQARLAFSVATAVRPDILIVDEVLSVGDAYFQHKSFERIREFRKQGTTLLIVSHDRMAIQSICDRAILLASGRLAIEGSPEEVMNYYNALIAERENSTVVQNSADGGRKQTISGTGEATSDDIALLNEKGDRVEIISVGSPVMLQIKVRTNLALPRLVLGYIIKDRLGQPVYGTNTYHLGHVLENLHAEQCIEYRFKFDANLGPGTYSVTVALHSADTHLAGNFEWRDLALVFSVINTNKDEFVGVAWLPPLLECQ